MCNEGFLESDDIQTGYIKPFGNPWRQIRYAVVDGLAIFEGCIILGPVEAVEASTKLFERDLAVMPKLLEDAGLGTMGAGIRGEQYRWRNRTVPFVIDPTLPDPARVQRAIDHWHARTSIRFVPRKTETDWLRIRPTAGGCASQVGRQGGMQDLILMDGCTTGNVIHELGHTVGLWHEQCRIDRDQWVKIDVDNAKPGTEHNFEQRLLETVDLSNYDYGSIMHYPPDAFAVTANSVTITPLKPLPAGVVMGQREALSPGDIAAVEALYAGVPAAAAHG